MNAPANVAEFTSGPLVLDEMIKLLSLFENPPEATHIRRALRFYEVPEHLRSRRYEWADTESMRRMLDHFASPQNPDELEWMLQFVRGKRSLLEVGSSFGGTLARMASVMPKGSQIVSVDLPCDDTPKFLNPGASLQETCRRLGILGANVNLFVGDSHEPDTVEAVSDLAPFDFAFIDGDHSYEGVRKDWEDYGPMAAVVAFHDVGTHPEVSRFWQELKSSGQYRTDECIAKADPKFGIGIVYRDG